MHNAYNTISCSYSSWLALLQNAYDKINEIIYELNFRFTDISQYYVKFNKTAGGLSLHRKRLYSFFSFTSNNIARLKSNLKSFNDTLNSIDIQIQETIDRLTRITYEKCIGAIWESITKNKSCVPDILQAQRNIFNGLLDGFNQCSNKPIIFEIEYDLSKGFQIPTQVFIDLIDCVRGVRKRNATEKAATERCLKAVNTEKASFRFWLSIPVFSRLS